MIEQQLECAYEHKQPIVSVVMDVRLQQNERLLCSECMELYSSQARTMGFKIAMQTIQESQRRKREQYEIVIDQNLKLLNTFQQIAIDLKTKVNKEIDSILNVTKFWMEDLNKIKSDIVTFSFHKELEKIIIQTQENGKDIDMSEISNSINKINNEWSVKINRKLGQFSNFEEQKKCETILNDLIQQKDENLESEIVFYDEKSISSIFKSNRRMQSIQNQKQSIKLILKDEQIKQYDTCYSMTFNAKGSIMVSSCLLTIKVWNFNQGSLKFIQNLQSHRDIVTCLLFSKKTLFFISGSCDKTIRCWKCSNQNEWKSSNPYQLETDFVQCMIMNKNETLLFTAGNKGSISIWRINFDYNSLAFLQNLHFNSSNIYSISLNEQENILISSGQNQSILIWEKVNEDKFKFKHAVKQTLNADGSHLTLLSDNKFIWVAQSAENTFICLYEMKNGSFQESFEKRITLKKTSNVEGLGLAPIIYNKEKKVIFVRSQHYLYILKEQNGCIYVEDQYDFMTEHNYFTTTDDCQYLVAWDLKKKAYSSFEILYN
ncbi:unnamed protein product (macronuclear) [Paramecium tetraurelia]|uniref:Uncharacterized protein n=1 Tax=Paramecium tetraurelia TaxID=5888 RepID=A0CCV7_PARTE|nr:uncharacterized protein GSPATT00037409001 [Paramecium tetraurelia]CAK68624.1 unnamed protein product [Paramecium tetraurelia]|eukprot:XP_001436021.1 hypothetical protein (macronuclear) [Paramecium tetraurelia strain d4-2]